MIAVAIALGVAQLSATVILVVMAVAWLLVCLFELAVWAEGPRFPTFVRERVEVDETTDPTSVAALQEPEPVPFAAERRQGEGA